MNIQARCERNVTLSQIARTCLRETERTLDLRLRCTRQNRPAGNWIADALASLLALQHWHQDTKDLFGS